MINFGSIFLVALALSMDAFSVAISLGINSQEFKKKLLFILLVGCCHYLFPWIGINLGKTFLDSFILNGEKVLGIILIILSIEMIYEYFHYDGEINFTYKSIILMAISVSIDSFMTGIGLYSLQTNIYIILLIFSITSMFFSLLGILLGKWFNKIAGRYSEVIGILILIIIGVKYCLF